MLTGNKDVDRMILNKLEDKDLVKVCQVNKQANSLCNDQVFWMNRVFQRYSYVPGDTLRKYKGDQSWSDYYISLKHINKKDLIDSSIKGRLDQVIIAVKNGGAYYDGLVWASYKGHLEIVKFIINSGTNIHADNNEALRVASEKGHLDIVKFLVQNNADIHTNNDYALKMASYYGHLNIVKYLVENGADPHVENDYALKYASRNGHLDVVKYLVEDNTDINSINIYLRGAKVNGYLDVVNYLESYKNRL